ncbi:hypothetical protein E1265_03600 [Streptomyces sp. 8K308]|uniref:Scr1 family TA system antitoxin-like transcriptional regulator n=1 Tax=Streptomyces sp. 8K308 TaxID=2530388 RepID=UPI00104F89E6|nr:Scr1 family TA system antitoxin-like transcriptional regulator [Streptomyces sp. 8K308]TDC26654.1 hypothetical protein E1265_03600 [Streptomyces sp. 8K308]
MDAQGLIRGIQASDQGNVGMVEHSEIGVPNLDKLATLDRAAVGVMSWSLLSIPGLLRTADYASTAIVAAQPYLPPYEVEWRTRKRSRRSVAFEDRLTAEAERAPGDGLTLTRAHSSSASALCAIRSPDPGVATPECIGSNWSACWR